MRLVIVGHARSGTTVLQNALNTCDQVYILGEANVYRGDTRPAFRERYNATHRGFGNQVTKSTYAPALDDCDENAGGAAYLAALERYYRYVGDKIALAHSRYGHDVDRIRNWLECQRARCLFVFRHPANVVLSTKGMFPHTALLRHVSSYATVAALYLDIVRVLPDVRCLIHERIRARSFRVIGAWLGLDLDQAWCLYDRARTEIAPWRSEIANYAEDLERLYEGVSSLAVANARAADPYIQLEQKVSPSGRTSAIGTLWRLAQSVSARADREADAAEAMGASSTNA